MDADTEKALFDRLQRLFGEGDWQVRANARCGMDRSRRFERQCAHGQGAARLVV